jgi:hypothetical protein
MVDKKLLLKEELMEQGGKCINSALLLDIVILEEEVTRGL